MRGALRGPRDAGHNFPPSCPGVRMMRSLLLTVALTAGGLLALPGRAAALPALAEDCDQSGATITCSAVDHPERVVIPSSATAVHVVLTGGDGGDAAGTSPALGGAGGITTTDLDLSARRTFDVFVGAKGGTGQTFQSGMCT